jgi:hypothetical protein
MAEGQPESRTHQRLLARAVAGVHAVQLADHLVALVQEHQRVLGQVVGEGRRRRSRRRAGQVPRVVLDALAVAQLAEHLQVEAGALLQALRLHQLARLDEEVQASLSSSLIDSTAETDLLARRHVVARRVDREARHLLPDAAGERIEQLQRLDLVVEQLDADRQLRVFGRKDVDGVAAHAEGAAEKSCSLRLYCMRISWPITSRWPILSPTRTMKRICV